MEELEGVKKIVDQAKKLHEKILDVTYGMTLERDLILKILSQPKCEGLRFYLCGRKIEGDDIHLSLVTVGVDGKGYDLKYQSSSGEKFSAMLAAGKSLPTGSLTAEYLTPPPPTGSTVRAAALKGQLDDRYTLLNLAKQKNDLEKVAKAKQLNQPGLQQNGIPIIPPKIVAKTGQAVNI